MLKNYDLFLSHKNEDKKIAEKIFNFFDKYNIYVFFDRKNLKAGNIDEKIITAIKNSKFFLLLFSENSNTKSYFKREFDNIINKDNVFILFYKINKESIKKKGFLLPIKKEYYIEEENEIEEILKDIAKTIIIEKLKFELNEKSITVKEIINQNKYLLEFNKERDKNFFDNSFIYHENEIINTLFNISLDKEIWIKNIENLLLLTNQNLYYEYKKFFTDKKYLKKIKTDKKIITKLEIKEEKKFFDYYKFLSDEKNICLINCKKINFTYKKDTEIIKNFNFKINEKEIITIVGKNAIGKTTLLKILSNHLKPSRGEIIFKFSKNKFDIKNKIKALFEIPIHNYNIHKLLISILIQNGYNCDKAIEVLELLYKRFDVKKYSNYKWSELSSGIKMRFLLLQIIILKPKIIILDEPLAFIDEKMIMQYLQDIKEISKRYNKAIIFTTHHLKNININFVDKILIFSKNKKIIKINLNKLQKSKYKVILIHFENNNYELMHLIKNNKYIKKYNILENKIFLYTKHKDIIINKLIEFNVGYIEDVTLSALRFYNEIF